MGIKGVIFDMDGTITAPYFEFDKIREEANIGDADMLDYLRSVTGAEHERIQGLLLKFEERGVANAKLNKGARAVLNALVKRKLPTALLTRNTRKSVDGICGKLKVKFDIEITREDGPHKPAPEPIWQIAKRWGAKPDEVLMVGDYKWDALCAKNAGTPCAILLEDGVTPDWAKEADFIIRKLAEVIGIVDGKISPGSGRLTREMA